MIGKKIKLGYFKYNFSQSMGAEERQRYE